MQLLRREDGDPPAERGKRQRVEAEDDRWWKRRGLDKAQDECLSDAQLRAYRRERDALRRSGEDEALVERLAGEICELSPACPPGEATAIAVLTPVRGSERVGRSAAGRALDDAAVTLAVVAFIRHKYTRYDELRMRGTDRAWARQQVQSRIEEMLDTWRSAPESAASSGARGPVSEKGADLNALPISPRGGEDLGPEHTEDAPSGA